MKLEYELVHSQNQPKNSDHIGSQGENKSHYSS